MIRRAAFAALFVTISASCVQGHVGAINLFADSDNRLFALESFQIPQMVLYLGVEISTDGPGFGVNFPTQGIEAGADFSVDVAFDLLYWDGSGLASPTSRLLMSAPDFDNQGVVNASPVEHYTVDGQSGYQSGIHWGQYNGANFWEAHGLNFLEPIPTPAGIYGLVVRVHSSEHLSSHPFVVPFVYDPDETWTTADEAVGIARLRDATAAIRFADLNSDGHVDVEDVDALVASIAAQTNLPEYDLNDDSVVDQADLDTWLANAARVNRPLGTESYLIGDANLDGAVDATDFLDWNQFKFSSGTLWSQGDFNADGVSDANDFLLWNENKYTAITGIPRIVPEPTLAVFGGLVSLLLFRWRRTTDRSTGWQ